MYQSVKLWVAILTIPLVAACGLNKREPTSVRTPPEKQMSRSAVATDTQSGNSSQPPIESVVSHEAATKPSIPPPPKTPLQRQTRAELTQQLTAVCNAVPKYSVANQLSKIVDHLCLPTGSNTSLIGESLAKAYDGQSALSDAMSWLLGERFFDDSDKQETHTEVLASMKLPLTASQYMERVKSVVEDDTQTNKIGMFAQADTITIESEEQRSAQEPGHLQGLASRFRSTSEIFPGLTVITEGVTTEDHWQIKPGEIYAMTSILSESERILTKANVLALVMDTSHGTYFIAFGQIAVQNEGFSRIVEPKLGTMIKDLLEGMYQVSLVKQG